ncbi:MAG TPA: prepilin-type N-terminal cleavage/methylation domain-containing protein [Blastocatellia bacterium]|nr:prepilin-type N-terminal cleavage/methylation domain-containing protein [Blastocatellia bacterium]HMV83422.1 prepilin-type N-terminal cleavage/methylation domain-containing protein [Blastocatellia bacterium]HMX24091.1 prepilin-type N-terminal cleavage/methylation domain-containing protein [Blastocatellia bacterium]HMY75007.1 prepilin-type N-terminal cleavage/methylation domain-containing protein [Blastocatellia bacterium]HMZ21153.1 prepilin-type N-terminal cleavage/methylation domain-contain
MKHKNHPQRRTQAGFSLIELLIVVAIIGILAAIALPKLQENIKLGRETAAIKSLGTIHTNQAQYNAMKGKFATLQELNQANLLDSNYSNGASVSGYVYASPEADADKYCVQATRQAATTAYKDFNVIEDGTIRQVESKTPSPVPHDGGTPLQGAGAGAGTDKNGNKTQ